MTSTRSPVLIPSSASMSRNCPGCTSSGGSIGDQRAGRIQHLPRFTLEHGDMNRKRLFGEVLMGAGNQEFIGTFCAGLKLELARSHRAISPVDCGDKIRGLAVDTLVRQRRHDFCEFRLADHAQVRFNRQIQRRVVDRGGHRGLGSDVRAGDLDGDREAAELLVLVAAIDGE